MGSPTVNGGPFVASSAEFSGGTALFNAAYHNTGQLTVNSGQVILAGGGIHGSTFTVARGAVLEFAGGTHTFEVDEDAVFDGAGRVELTGGTWTGEGDLHNRTEMDYTGGSIDLAGDFYNEPGGVFNALVPGPIVARNFVNDGLLTIGASPGTLNIDGNYEQSGTLDTELAGLSDFDRLMVSDQARLGGTLQVRFYGGYRGNAGDSFAVVTAGEIVDDFSRITKPAGYGFDGGTGCDTVPFDAQSAPRGTGTAGTPAGVTARNSAGVPFRRGSTPARTSLGRRSSRGGGPPPGGGGGAPPDVGGGEPPPDDPPDGDGLQGILQASAQFTSGAVLVLQQQSDDTVAVVILGAGEDDEDGEDELGAGKVSCKWQVNRHPDSRRRYRYRPR